jgi:hypothetical protein
MSGFNRKAKTYTPDPYNEHILDPTIEFTFAAGMSLRAPSLPLLEGFLGPKKKLTTGLKKECCAFHPKTPPCRPFEFPLSIIV